MSFITYIGEARVEVDGSVSPFHAEVINGPAENWAEAYGGDVTIYSIRFDGKDIKDRLNDRAIELISVEAFEQLNSDNRY